MSAFKTLNTLIKFRDEIYDNLEAKTGWGKNQLKDMIDTVFEKHRKILEEIEDANSDMS